MTKKNKFIVRKIGRCSEISNPDWTGKSIDPQVQGTQISFSKEFHVTLGEKREVKFVLVKDKTDEDLPDD